MADGAGAREAGRWEDGTDPAITASTLAHWLLNESPSRLQHVGVVVAKAEMCAAAMPVQLRPVLIAAAWVHDIGYAAALCRTGVHSLDGAMWLAARGVRRLAALTAHHSACSREAVLRGFGAELRRYPRESSAVADALTYCDMTVGPSGEPMTLDERIADVARRYGVDSLTTRSLIESYDELAGAIRRTEALLVGHGVDQVK